MRDFRFDLTVSDQAFEKKLPKGSPIYSTITFTQRNISIEEFAELILQGHLFSGVYNKQHFPIKYKTKDNFICTNAIAIDIDDSDCSMDDYLTTLPYTPTIAYETFSNLQEGYGYRYRFVYVFEDTIDGNAYGVMYNAVCNANHIVSSSNDQSMKSCNQMFYGTANASNLINFGKTYSTCVFKDYMDNESVQLQSLIYNNTHHNKALKLDSNQTFNFNDKSFEKQWQCGNDIEVLMSMRHYQTSECTQLDFNEGELWRDLDDEHYYEIKRKWEARLVFNGGTYKRTPVNRRLKNGEHRRKKIFLSLMRRRLINPTLTLEHLCYAALYELHFFIDNTDTKDYITSQQLKEIAVCAMNTDLERYSEKLRENKKYKINKMERIKRGLTPSQAVAMANTARRKKKTEKKYEQLSKKYDPNKSVRDNAALLGVSNGTIQSLKKWIKERDKKEEKPMTREEQERDMYNMVKELYDYYMPKPIKAPENNFLDFLKNSKKNLAISNP